MLPFEYMCESNASLNAIPTTDSSTTAIRVVENEKHKESINIPNNNLKKLAQVVEKQEE